MTEPNEPPPAEPDGWRERKTGNYALVVVIVGIAIFLGIGVVSCVVALAQYG